MKSAFLMVAVVAAGVVVWTPGRVSAQAAGSHLTPEQKVAERKAISAFAAGNYPEAVTIYSELYADYREPIYLRNIGRCHQKLKNADKAIASFEEYLNKAKNISAEEKKEISGYMDEMRALREKPAVPPSAPATNAGPPAPLPSSVPLPSAPPPSSAPSPLPVPPAGPLGPAPLPPPSGTVMPSVGAGPYQPFPPSPVAPPPAGDSNIVPVDTAQSLGAQPASNSGIRWVGKGALILSGLAAVASGGLLLASWSTYNDNKDGNCLAKGAGECSSAADRIDRLNLLSGITLGLAVASAATGGIILYLYPASPSASGLQAGVAWTY